MRYLLTGLRYVLAVISGLALLLTLVSVVPSSEWWVQMLGFPRLQTLAVLAVGLLGLLALGWPAHRRAWALLLLEAVMNLCRN